MQTFIIYEKLCFSNNKSTPSLWVTHYVCVRWWADVFTSVSVCVRQSWWHNSVAGVWLKLSYAEVIGCFPDPSLSVSQEASSIIRDWGTRPPSPNGVCWLKHIISLDQYGRINIYSMMSVLKNRPTTDQRQCLIIAQGHLRLSVPAWKMNSMY